MDTGKWVTLLAGVLFLGAFSPADACKCVENNLQRSYCTSDVVLKLKFQKATTQDGMKGYEVKVIEVLKGNVKKELVKFITIMAGTDCEYSLSPTDFNKDYIITGSYNNGKVSVGKCSYSNRWDNLSHQEKKGAEGAYKKGCSCAIESCSAQPCPTKQKTCTIDEYNGGEAKKQLKKQRCVPVNPTTCKWEDIY
ncbi:metalloproteinase inhibitor 3-like [Lissotriton helveticus]